MSEMIMLAVNGAPDMQAFVAAPQGSGPFPALILFQEAFGVNHYMRHMAERMAAEGYVTIVPELFHRTAPVGFEAGYTQFQDVMPHMQAVNADTIIDDARAAYDWLLQQNAVVKDKIGCMGFCLGGRAAYLANTALPLAASVSFYGAQMHTMMDRVHMASGPQLLFWGGKDNHIKPEHVQQVVDAFRQSGREYINVEISYADHGFFCDEREAYHPQAAREAWGMVKEFLKNKLKG